jgi:hypothetical protein
MPPARLPLVRPPSALPGRLGGDSTRRCTGEGSGRGEECLEPPSAAGEPPPRSRAELDPAPSRLRQEGGCQKRGDLWWAQASEEQGKWLNPLHDVTVQGLHAAVWTLTATGSCKHDSPDDRHTPPQRRCAQALQLRPRRSCGHAVPQLRHCGRRRPSLIPAAALAPAPSSALLWLPALSMPAFGRRLRVVARAGPHYGLMPHALGRPCCRSTYCMTGCATSTSGAI